MIGLSEAQLEAIHPNGKLIYSEEEIAFRGFKMIKCPFGSVGYKITHEIPRTADICWAFVVKQYRRRGVLRRMIEKLKTKESVSVIVAGYVSSETAFKAWSALGFEQHSEGAGGKFLSWIDSSTIAPHGMPIFTEEILESMHPNGRLKTNSPLPPGLKTVVSNVGSIGYSIDEFNQLKSVDLVWAFVAKDSRRKGEFRKLLHQLVELEKPLAVRVVNPEPIKDVLKAVGFMEFGQMMILFNLKDASTLLNTVLGSA